METKASVVRNVTLRRLSFENASESVGIGVTATDVYGASVTVRTVVQITGRVGVSLADIEADLNNLSTTTVSVSACLIVCATHAIHFLCILYAGVAMSNSRQRKQDQ